MQPWHQSPRRLSAVCFFVLALTFHARAADPNHLIAFTPASIGSYSICSALNDSFVVGNISAGVDCESRGFVSFSIAAATSTIVAGDLFIPLYLVSSSSGDVEVELHAVNATLVDLLNANSREQIFQSLGNGPILGKALVPAGVFQFQNYQRTALATVPLTPLGVETLNGARGKQVLLGVSLAHRRPSSDDPSSRESLVSGPPESMKFVLQTINATAPEIRMQTPASGLLLGTSFSLAAAVAGKEPIRLQWTRNEIPIPHATNRVLFFPSFSTANIGSYALQASNALGTAVGPSINLQGSPLEIIEPLQNTTLYEGSPRGCLSITAVGSDVLRYHWLREGMPLPPERTPVDQPSLCFAPVQFSDAGKYEVLISNSYGSIASSVATVTVLPSPARVEAFSPPLTSVAASFSANLFAAVSGSPPLSLQWLKNTKPIDGANSNQLTLSKIQLADSGDYQLRVSNPWGSVTSSVARVEVRPAILSNQSGSNLNLPLGYPRALRYQITAVPDTTLQWYQQGQALPGETNPFLWKNPVTEADNGDFFLVASNSFGVSTSDVVRITAVKQQPSGSIAFASRPPGLLGNPVRLQLTPTRPPDGGGGGGDRQAYPSLNILTIEGIGAPPPSIQWFRDGQLLANETNETFFIPSAQLEHQGSYTVQLSNAVGMATTAPLDLQILSQAPSFLSDPTAGPISETAGSLLTIPSSTTAGPPARYRWKKDGIELPEQTNATLIFPRLETEESGNYEVVAANGIGTVSQTFTLQVRPKTALDDWKWNLPRPQGGRLKDIAWGNGRAVAVGKAGNIMMSTNGVDWSHSLVDATGDLEFVEYGNGVFVATHSKGFLLVSTNGTDWSPLLGPAAKALGLSFGNGRFVIIDPNTISTSTNGVDWSSQIRNDPAWLFSIDWFGFVQGEFWVAFQSRLLRSSDGLNWHPATQTVLGEFLGQLAYGAGRYVLVGNWGTGFGNWTPSGVSQTSLDGTQWTSFSETNQIILSVAFGNHRFVGLLDSPAGSVAVSDDGLHWTQHTTTTDQELEKIIFADDRFWAVGEAGIILTSTNGIDWSKNSSETRTAYYGVARFHDQVVIAGDNGRILTSSDTVTWSQQPTPSSRNLHTVQLGGGRLVAAGRGGRIMTSEDGVSWSSRPSGTSNYIERLYWAGGWVAVCEEGDILTSDDGLSWTAAKTSVATDHEGVTYGDGLWVVVGGYFGKSAHSTTYVSSNRTNWTLLPFTIGLRLRDIAFGKGDFVAVGNDGLVAVFSKTRNPLEPLKVEGHYVATGANFRRIVFSRGQFIAVCNNGEILSSLNPRLPSSWIHHRSHTSQNLHDILARPDGTFIAIGNNGMILHSGESQPYFEGIQVQGNDVILDFVLPKRPGPFRLEGSADMSSWVILPDAVVSPARIPVNNQSPRYFRVTAP